jgi:cytochrome c-type biogenesis protein
MGVLKIPGLSIGRQIKLPAWAERLGHARAFLIGVVFATAWTPCVGAVLGAILTLAAATQTAATGAAMLFVYSLGISIPFLLVSLIIAQVPNALKSFNKYLGVVSKVAGILLFIIGFLLFNNTVGLISDKLTYNRLNSLLFEIAFRFGFEI